MGTPFSNTRRSHTMKFFAVVPTLLAVCAAEAQLPIAAQYLGAAGLYQGYSGLTAGAYASPYAAYGPAAVDAKFAYGAPITALNAGPLTAAPGAASVPVAAYTATAPLPTATYAAAYTTAPVAVAAPAVAAVAPAAYAAAPIAGPCQLQFQAQDEYGNVAYGYQNINSAKQERGNALGGVTGSYTYQDEAGVHTVNYIADALGFRVASDNLPIAPVFDGVAPVAPVYSGVAPLPVSDTAEVAAAKADFFKAFNAAKKTKRSAEAQYGYGGLYNGAYGAGLYNGAIGGLYNGAYGAGLYNGAYGFGLPAVAPATYAAAPIAPLAAAPVATYAAAPLAAAVAPVAAPLAAVAPAAYAASAPAYAAAATGAPSREAVLTTIKLNPGHATFYRVD